MLLLDIKEGKDRMSMDPFRMIKVSDLLPVGHVNKAIVYAVNKKKVNTDTKTRSSGRSVYTIMEIIKEEAIFEGFINLDKPLSDKIIKNPIKDLQTLLKSSHAFFVENFKKEKEVLKNLFNISHPAGLLANKKFVDKFKKSVFLVRIGKHSGAEAVTIEGNRRISVRQGKNKEDLILDHSTTFWLAANKPKLDSFENVSPFGWAALELCDM